MQAKPEPGSPWRGPGSLSGGQVALVGLALNLATQAVRSAPLYLMDEVRIGSRGEHGPSEPVLQRVSNVYVPRAQRKIGIKSL